MEVNKTSKPLMRTLDMTQGNSLRLILAFAIPLFIGNIFQQIYSVVDTMVAGYTLGDQAIAAIGASSALYGLIINCANGMNNGYGIVVTQAFGAHNEKTMKQAIAGTLLLNLLVTVVLTSLSLLFLRPMLRFMNTPETIFRQTYTYIAIICLGMAATNAYNMFAALLRALGNSRSPLYFLILSCFLNVVLDVLLVVVIPMGIAGTAVATVLAQSVSAAFCGLYVWKNYRSILPEREDFRVPSSILRELVSTGFSMAMMLCVVDLGSVIFQRANNALGEAIIAAHTAARRIIQITMQPLGTISTANSTFVAQNWGAGKTERICSSLKQVIGLQILWSVLACGLIFLFGGTMISFTTGSSDQFIIRNAVLSMRIHLLCYPALGVLLCLRTTMQAMGHKTIPILSSCIELAMKILSACWLIPHFGFLGTCITEPVTWILMMFFLLSAYWAKKDKLFAAS